MKILPIYLSLILLFPANIWGQANVWNSVGDKSNTETFLSVYAFPGSIKANKNISEDSEIELLWVGSRSGNIYLIDNAEAKDKLTFTTGKGLLLEKGKSFPINDIYFRTAQNGYLLLDNAIYASNGLGLNWDFRSYTTPVSDKLNAKLYSIGVFPEKKSGGCIVGAYYKNDVPARSLIKCSEGNVASGIWNEGTLRQESLVDMRRTATTNFELQNELLRVKLYGNKKGWAVGTGGVILHTTDGGKNWTQQKSPTNKDLYGIDFVEESDAQTGWAVGTGGTILQTNNGGETWEEFPKDKLPSLLPGDKIEDLELQAVSFIGKRGWIIGDKGYIFYTGDGGKQWFIQAILPFNTRANLYAISIGKKYVWCVGDKGTILRQELNSPNDGKPRQANPDQSPKS